jgi:uncharacterized membrane protein SpoIIM required for sporulation
MKVSDLLESRRENWRELEALCSQMERWWSRRLEGAATARFSALYRAVCADLALADAYQLPPETIQYLHRLVGRAHNQLYRSRPFQVAAWARQLLVDVPRRLFQDNCLRLAFCLFWGPFLLSMAMVRLSPGYAESVVGEGMLGKFEDDFSRPFGERGSGDAAMAGFYIWNNGGIGLRCFAFGLFLGVGGVLMTVYNGCVLGAVFGHVSGLPQRENFYAFVTAHGPFELTAIVLSAAAGMRLGFSIIDTRGLTRLASLRKAGEETMPVAGAAVIMFGLAALIEGFVSPSPLPYAVKALTAGLSTAMLLFYLIVLGYPRGS